MAAAKKPVNKKKVPANSKAGAKTTVEKAQAAGALAYGKEKITVADINFFGSNRTKAEERNQYKIDKLKTVSRTINPKKTIAENVNLKVSPGKTKLGSGVAQVYNAKLPKVESDVYNLLMKKAKAAGLRGTDADIAVEKAMKAVSTRVRNDRQRTAKRGSFIVRREASKRRNTDLS